MIVPHSRRTGSRLKKVLSIESWKNRNTAMYAPAPMRSASALHPPTPLAIMLQKAIAEAMQTGIRTMPIANLIICLRFT